MSQQQIITFLNWRLCFMYWGTFWPVPPCSQHTSLPYAFRLFWLNTCFVHGCLRQFYSFVVSTKKKGHDKSENLLKVCLCNHCGDLIDKISITWCRRDQQEQQPIFPILYIYGFKPECLLASSLSYSLSRSSSVRSPLSKGQAELPSKQNLASKLARYYGLSKLSKLSCCPQTNR